MSEQRVLAEKNGRRRRFGQIQWDMMKNKKTGDRDGWEEVADESQPMKVKEPFVPKEVAERKDATAKKVEKSPEEIEAMKKLEDKINKVEPEKTGENKAAFKPEITDSGAGEKNTNKPKGGNKK